VAELEMLFMVIEHFKDQDMLPAYKKLREQGRTLPDGPCMDDARGARGIWLSAKRSGAVMYPAFECGR
jgi:hypothetical protein